MKTLSPLAIVLSILISSVSPQPVWAMSCVEFLRDALDSNSLIAAKSSAVLDKTLVLSENLIANSSRALKKEWGIKPRKGPGSEEVWHVDGVRGAREDYESTFSEIFNKIGVSSSHRYFDHLLERARSNGLSTNALDLMGSGFFIENQVLADSITGMRMGPYARSELPKGFPVERVPTEILGDIINPVTWSKLDQSLVERGVDQLDLVTLKPVGGWESAPWSSSARGNILALKFIMGNVIKRLSSDGHFYFHISFSFIPGKLSEHLLLQRLIKDIENKTNHRLILKSNMTLPGYSISGVGSTTGLYGALIPKHFEPEQF